jgi:diamine N-acetyltransferase
MMNSAENIKIENCTFDQIDTLVELSSRTFYHAFVDQNKEDDVLHYINETFKREKLLEELHNKACTFLIAYVDDSAVGYAKISRDKTQKEIEGKKAMEIERIYVLPTMIGKKVGKLLMEKCLEIAQSENAQVIWLGVWEHNPRAITFYEKWGFEVFSSHGFQLGSDLQTDLLMKKELR